VRRRGAIGVHITDEVAIGASFKPSMSAPPLPMGSLNSSQPTRRKFRGHPLDDAEGVCPGSR